MGSQWGRGNLARINSCQIAPSPLAPLWLIIKVGGKINLKVIKRDGRAVEYNSEKICVAIEKANKEVTEENI